MRIYTRTGDKGQTSLANGKRVSKTNCLVEIFGNLDELNSLLGICLNLVKSKEAKIIIPKFQNYIFSLGSQIALARPGTFEEITGENVKELEIYIDRVEKKLPRLKNFVLPGGTPSAAFLHLARAVCRRAERTVVTTIKPKLNNQKNLIPFINRVSDLLFVLARLENKLAKGKEIYWNRAKKIENH